jgi:hypothetical protein
MGNQPSRNQKPATRNPKPATQNPQLLINRRKLIRISFTHNGVNGFINIFGTGITEIITIGSVGGSMVFGSYGYGFVIQKIE